MSTPARVVLLPVALLACALGSARVAAQARPTPQRPATAQPQVAEPAPVVPAAPAAPASPRPPQSDIDAAADTVSDVAAMPPAGGELDAAADTVSAVAAQDSAALDAELEALGLSAENAGIDTALKIYGFAAFNFMNAIRGDKQAINQFINKESTFYIGDLNIYMSKNFSEVWRTMMELRLTYAPNGRVLPDGVIEPNQSYDQGFLGRLANWGGINIERAYLEYDIHPNITIQGGTFLTPYGIWNVDHGAPAIIPWIRPYILVEQLFPERQTGLHIYGRIPLGDYVLGYHATLSNGRGFYDAFRDLDDSKAFGGRLLFETPWLGSLRFGISAYHGRFVDRDSDRLVPNPETMKLENTTPKGSRYDEFALAGDILWQWGGFHFQAELIGRNFGYLEDARAPDGMGFRPDSYSFGGYALLGYRFKYLWNVMPFIFYQRYKREESSATATFSALENYHVGLNFRPIPALVFKIQFGQTWIPGGKPPVEGDDLFTIALQAAWVF